jgi:hypothetical protein
VIRVSWWVTGAFAVAEIAGVLVSPLRGVAALVAILMFLGGTGLMAWALVIAAGRSRTDAVEIGGLFFSQPPRDLKVAFGLQIVVGLAAAGIRPNTGSAFGVLAPVFGLGLMGMWGARHGRFPAREA